MNYIREPKSSVSFEKFFQKRVCSSEPQFYFPNCGWFSTITEWQVKTVWEGEKQRVASRSQVNDGMRIYTKQSRFDLLGRDAICTSAAQGLPCLSCWDGELPVKSLWRLGHSALCFLPPYKNSSNLCIYFIFFIKHSHSLPVYQALCNWSTHFTSVNPHSHCMLWNENYPRVTDEEARGHRG